MSTVLGLIELCWGDVGPRAQHPAPGPGQRGDRGGRQRRAAAALQGQVGVDGDHRAQRRQRLGRDPHDRAQGRRPLHPQRREDLRDRGRALRLRGGVGEPRPQLGRAAIKSFVVEKGTPGMEVARLEHKLGIKASDTATILFTECRVPKENLLGSPEVDVKAGLRRRDADLRQHAPGRGRDGYRRRARRAREGARAAQGAGLPRRVRPQPLEHLVGRSRAVPHGGGPRSGRACSRSRPHGWPTTGSPTRWKPRWRRPRPAAPRTTVTLRCSELCGALGYEQSELLEKWARDSKILDIFEGTQQIQLLIVARRLLGKSSAELK